MTLKNKEISSKQDVFSYLGGEGILIVSKAAEKIIDQDNSVQILEEISDTFEGNQIDSDDVDEYIEICHEIQNKSQDENITTDKTEETIVNNSEENKENKTDGNIIDPKGSLRYLSEKTKKEDDEIDTDNRKETLDERHPDLCSKLFDREFPDIEPRENNLNWSVRNDITDNSTGQGDIEDFESLFEDRYEKLHNIMDKKCSHAIPISDLSEEQHAGENLTIYGLVWDKWSNDNDNYFVEIEDVKSNQKFPIVFTSEKFKDLFEKIVLDEFIAIRGTISDNGEILFGDDEYRHNRPPIMFPGVGTNILQSDIYSKSEVAFISDLHIGAEDFYPDYWNKFVDWVRKNPDIKYICISGDIVEGVGVYPGQEEELEVLDIKDQYALAGRMFEYFPDDVEIIASVGNHDAVRLAEPQPTLDGKYKFFFPDNVSFVGNPANITIEDDVSILLYHGMSINTFSELVPDIDITPPTDALELMLEKRHLSPIWGKNVRIAPEKEDYLVIEETPDVLHCGHVHKYGAKKYENVHLLNTACWQGQTDFQKSKGIEPDVGYWSVIDLSTLKHRSMNVDQLTDV